MKKVKKKRRVGYKELAIAFLEELKKAEKKYPIMKDPFCGNFYDLEKIRNNWYKKSKSGGS